MEEVNPYESLFWDMVESGFKDRASDIHLQPERNGVQIRFRIHGELMDWKWVSDIHKIAFLQEAKRLSQCSLAVCGRSQDVRFSMPSLKLDVRVNLVPSLYGEKLVFRLLDQSRSFDLDSFKIGADAISAVKNTISRGIGVCLITGPTGSGKTTLLYSALSALDRKRMNIITIEDPVEYSLSGITQLQAGTKLTFGDALRAVLRQDPDVILVGEIRDQETAQLCFQAAATGHLVLSTLHANSAKEVKGRLRTLGVREDLLSSCLRFSSAQRLLPELCPSCCEPLTETDQILESELKCSREDLRKSHQAGCRRCRCGLVGLLPIFEFIEWSEEGDGEVKQSPLLKQAAFALARQGKVSSYDAAAI